eukprot:6195978-Pleurochrysis_carterae.AAC.4
MGTAILSGMYRKVSGEGRKRGSRCESMLRERMQSSALAEFTWKGCWMMTLSLLAACCMHHRCWRRCEGPWIRVQINAQIHHSYLNAVLTGISLWLSELDVIIDTDYYLSSFVYSPLLARDVSEIVS